MPTKVYLVKAMVFPAVMYGCESQTIKETERWRIDAFELWCWRKLLKSPLNCKEIKLVNSNQSWLFIGRTDAEAEAPTLWPPDAKNWLIGKTLMLGKMKAGRDGDDRGWDGWMTSPTQWTWVWVGSGSLWWTGRPGVLLSMTAQGVGHDWVTALNWISFLWSGHVSFFFKQIINEWH